MELMLMPNLFIDWILTLQLVEGAQELLRHPRYSGGSSAWILETYPVTVDCLSVSSVRVSFLAYVTALTISS